MGQRSDRILLGIVDIYTINLIFYCVINVFVEKFQFHHYVDGVDLCILTGIGLFSYIGQSQFSARIGENGRAIVVAAGLLLTVIAIHGTQGYENFGTLLRYLGCAGLIYLAWQSPKICDDDRLFVLKTEVMIGLVLLAALLTVVGKGPGISQIYFLMAILLNLMRVTSAHVFRAEEKHRNIRAWVGLLYGLGLLLCVLWLCLQQKARSLCAAVAKTLIIWTKTMLFYVEQAFLWIYQHLDTVHKKNAPVKVVKENYEDGGVDVTIGVVVILLLAALVLTLLFVLLWEIFKKRRTAQKSKAQKRKSAVRAGHPSTRHSLALWIRRRKSRRIGPKKFLYKLAKLCKSTECRMKDSDTPKSFMDKVSKAYAPEGTALGQKMSAMTAELNACYYGKTYSYRDFSNQEAAGLLKEIKAAIKKRKREQNRCWHGGKSVVRTIKKGGVKHEPDRNP